MLNKEAKPIWLASYPKSGNTWVRLFLDTLTGNKAVDINDIAGMVISSRNVIDETLGINSSSLPESDFLKYRSWLYHKWVNKFKGREYLLCKVHDACALRGEILFPAATARGVIYILRNPFDMAASYANHQSVSIDQAVKMLCSNDNAIARKKEGLNTQLSQHLGTWSHHVESWTNVHRKNILIVKYENLLNDGLNEFSKLVRYIGLDDSNQAIQNAISKTDIKDLQRQEQLNKFKETPNVERFFRSGKSGGWKNEITKQQAELIIDVNYEALLKYGYIDAAGNILV